VFKDSDRTLQRTHCASTRKENSWSNPSWL